MPGLSLSLAGLRGQAARYWLVAICLGGFLSAYVSPMVLALRGTQSPGFVLPGLEVPTLAFPSLNVPELGLASAGKAPARVSAERRERPSAVPAATAAAAPASTQPQATQQVPVVSNSYVRTAQPRQAAETEPAADAFAGVPVVESSIGAAPAVSHPLVAASAPPEGDAVTTELTQAELDAAVAQAASEWGTDPAELGVTFTIADLADLLLGSTTETTVTIDATAAGHGWAAMDLLTVVRHEIGHLLGHDHDEGGVMSETLAPGESHPVFPVESSEPPPEPATVTAPSAVDLGPTKVGTSSSAPVTVSNTGGSNLDITAVTASEGSPFTVSGPSLPTTIAPSESIEITVSFAPVSPGAVEGTLIIESSVGPVSVALSGFGTVPRLAAPVSADAGDVLLGTTAAQLIELANTGDAELTIAELTVADDAGGAFGIDSGVPMTIAPGGSASIGFSMSP